MFQQTGKFTNVEPEANKITFRQDTSEQKENFNYSNKQNIDSSNFNFDKQGTNFTPKKLEKTFNDNNQPTITKKPSLIFKSAKRNIIYFEEDVPVDQGDPSSNHKGQNLYFAENSSDSKVGQIANSIIKKLRLSGREVNEQAICKSVEMIMSMPPE